MMADMIVVSDSKGKGKSTDPALNEEKKEDDDDDDEEDDEPVIMSGRRKRNVVNYADVRLSFFPLVFLPPFPLSQREERRRMEEEKRRREEKKGKNADQ
jgi:hypothetical protein